MLTFPSNRGALPEAAPVLVLLVHRRDIEPRPALTLPSKGGVERRGKLAAAAFYFERLLPRTLAFAASVRAGGATLPALSPEHFAA